MRNETTVPDRERCVKKKLCQCDKCVMFRSKGLKAKFTPEECRAMSEYAHAMMQACRERNRRKT